MGLVNFLRRFCIIKDVRNQIKESSGIKQDENDVKIPYVGISENVFLSDKEIKIEEIGKEIGENINQEISKLTKKNSDELNEISEDVKKERSMFGKKINPEFGDKDYEKTNMVCSGFDILLSAIKDEIQKRNNLEK
ncbi:Hypothetical protein Nlim_0336 [Candidatus Nitrosarchaeum limnium SFB1]|jgi:hypothetical protein|uniref:Uncharacterized protein n=1 Tax=Candidatus Nitrosarchaeum limnium SFB1 TaxID=886738 RepID=F3KIN7_9ARCH|nr:Hypothetical protein Nlim_0336 [Candidatus Nitrosarchaeum limnium SFB1]